MYMQSAHVDVDGTFGRGDGGGPAGGHTSYDACRSIAISKKRPKGPAGPVGRPKSSAHAAC